VAAWSVRTRAQRVKRAFRARDARHIFQECLSALPRPGSTISAVTTLIPSEMWGFKKTLLRRLVIAAVCIAAAAASHSAERWSGLADTVFQNLARGNELPNAAIPTSAAQDADGFLWIGSQNGLARWDGYHYRLYRAEPGKPGALPDNFIQALLTDARGVLWIGTTSGGLARYDREHERFVVYPAGPQGLSHVSVRAIVEDGEGGVWVATEGGLDHVRWGSDTIEHLRHVEGDPSSLPDDRVRGLLRDRHGTLWVGTATALVRMDKGSTRLQPVPLPAAQGKVRESSGAMEFPGGQRGAYLGWHYSTGRVRNRLSHGGRPSGAGKRYCSFDAAERRCVLHRRGNTR
jgi:hypothetical protein